MLLTRRVPSRFACCVWSALITGSDNPTYGCLKAHIPSGGRVAQHSTRAVTKSSLPFKACCQWRLRVLLVLRANKGCLLTGNVNRISRPCLLFAPKKRCSLQVQGCLAKPRTTGVLCHHAAPCFTQGSADHPPQLRPACPPSAVPLQPQLSRCRPCGSPASRARSPAAPCRRQAAGSSSVYTTWRQAAGRVRRRRQGTALRHHPS